MKAKPICSILIALVFGLVACNLPTAPSVAQATPENAGAATAQAETAFSLAVAQTMEALGTPPAPLEPEASATPSLTSTPTLTPTSSVPMVTVSVGTNCRVGPGQAYDQVGALVPGQEAEVVARHPQGTYWYIRNPSNPSAFCWLWGQYATVTGDTSGLPVFTPPPTPTPAPGFTVSYLGVTSCAPQYAFRFQIQNNGSVTWESIRINITDNTSATAFTHILDSFRSYNGCVLESDQLDLLPGEGGVVANVSPGQLNYDPAGHSISAVITLCTANGLGGTCVSQSLNFTP
ncbi:MAG: hypothetical protein JXB85_04670 [Anaerolineales bacterium]|nr:hypothetical protein [Anaerolineales bacterium]